jgi:hypothetical protein
MEHKYVKYKNKYLQSKTNILLGGNSVEKEIYFFNNIYKK